MNTNDWQTVHQQLRDDDRRRLGDPPTAEEVLAYSRGELPPDEEARVREKLVAYPELLRTITEPFPTEGAEQGDPDYLSDDEFAWHWASMQKRMRRGEGARVIPLWRYSTAIAASLAIVFGMMWWRTTARLSEPRIVREQQVLYPDGRRGPSETPVLEAHGESVLLVVPLVGEQHSERYRLAILDADTNRALWRSAELRPGEDDAFAIVVPRPFLKPGVYQVVVYGVGAEPLATYSLRVPAR